MLESAYSANHGQRAALECFENDSIEAILYAGQRSLEMLQNFFPVDLIDDQIEQVAIVGIYRQTLRVYISLTDQLVFESKIENLAIRYFEQQGLVSVQSSDQSLVFHTKFLAELKRLLEEGHPPVIRYQGHIAQHSANIVLGCDQIAFERAGRPLETLNFATFKFSLQGTSLQIYKRMGDVFQIDFAFQEDADGVFAYLMFVKRTNKVVAENASVLTSEPDGLEQDIEICHGALQTSSKLDRSAFKQRINESIHAKTGADESDDDYQEVNDQISRPAELLQYSNILFRSQNKSALLKANLDAELDSLEIQPIFSRNDSTRVQNQSNGLQREQEAASESDSVIEIDITEEQIRAPQNEQVILPCEKPVQEAVTHKTAVTTESPTQTLVASAEKATESDFSKEQFFQDLEALQFGVQCQNAKGKPAFIKFKVAASLILVVQAGCRNVTDVVADIEQDGESFGVVCEQKTHWFRAHPEQTQNVVRAVRNLLRGIELGERGYED